MDKNSIATRLELVKQRMRQAEIAHQRPAGSVHLIAVSKTKTSAQILEAIDAGQREFGESYAQEALPKIEALAGQSITWHFIGPVQKNKTRLIACNFDWVHSVDRMIIAERLNEQRPLNLPPLNICLQINSSGEGTKSGVAFEEVENLANAVRGLPNLKLRGLMCIPALTSSTAAQEKEFKQTATTFNTLNEKGYDLDTLSMGMSNDMEAAIGAGSTLVRVGTAIFGAR